MLSKLRLQFADRPDIELAVEADEDQADAWALLRAQADVDGRIHLGDRETCSIDEVVDVELLRAAPLQGPEFERGLQDEDVSAALSENYDDRRTPRSSGGNPSFE
jgi:hypothetical protein